MWYLIELTAKQNDSSLYQLMIKLIAQMVCCYSNSPFFCKDKNSNASETYTHTRYTCQNRIRWNYWLYARQEASNGLKRTDGLQDWSGGWLILQEWPALMQPLVRPPGGAHYPSSSSAMRKDFLEMRLIGNRQQQSLLNIGMDRFSPKINLLLSWYSELTEKNITWDKIYCCCWSI